MQEEKDLNENLQKQENPEEYVSGEDYREQMQELQPQTAPLKQAPTWKQKAAVIFLAIFGVTAVILWVMQFRSGLVINKPAPQQQPQVQQVDLQKQDTDQDGLSDYDELYFYNTSPYIEDTDSDGITDKSEIDAGQDPNCPTGQDCFESSEFSSQSDGSSDINNTSNNMPNAQVPNAQTSQTFSPDQEQIMNVLSGQADADILRQFLGSAGMSSEMLEGISDEQLLEIYQSTATEGE